MPKPLIIPKGYKSYLGVKETEGAIKTIKDFFQLTFATELRLRRVTAPLFVRKGTGINDDLNGIEKPVSFGIKDANIEVEVVHSLAKWKRLMLADYDIGTGFGIYCDMNAIRADEELDNIHSIYVDQWDWELAIKPEQRNLHFLKKIVEKIYGAIKRTEYYIHELYPKIMPELPDHITFIHAEDLLKKYPELTPFERENKIAKKYGAVFIIGIGHPLKDGKPHDGRAPDYDDWSTETDKNYHGLNGDIILWNPVLKRAYEVSSMGIRVDKAAMEKQLSLTNTESRKSLYFHRRLLNGELPLSIGGGIGQSRLCMYYLRKAHIGEIQSSIWPEDMIESCRKHNIVLL